MILFLSIQSKLNAENPTSIPFIGKNNYISFGSLSAIFKNLKLKIDYGSQKCRIISDKSEIRFKLDSLFYVHDSSIEKISRAPVYRNHKLLLPPDLVEAIFIHLIKEDISYEFGKDRLVIDKIIPEEGLSGKMKLKRLIIDAGHGGKDPGSSDAKGYQEKDITLKTSLVLRDFLKKKFPSLKIIMTRSSDKFIELEERSKIANAEALRSKDSIFISLHCNSSISEEPTGFEIYFLSQTPSTEMARELSIIENKVLDNKNTRDVKKIQAGMLSSYVQRSSKKLAVNAEKGLEKWLSGRIVSRGVKKADFSVLRGSLMPAILIEMGYLSNKKESELLRLEKMQLKLSKGIVAGILEYSNSKN
ncbi:MAG: N-acetylmuramoyl-L-alanine amidase [Leptospira sp.]|nr:N-acetylmuramoyl-L-alanine amidase [Leptospira sp.]